ncbi:MAG: GGDEF domain-containing protein [Eubacterium sp.]|nr:GGDEF domain-containing protein [Eubacterium sp.]
MINSQKKSGIALVIVLVILTAIAWALNFTQGEVTLKSNRPYEESISFEDGWKTEDGQSVSGRKVFRFLQPDQTLVLTKNLPDQLYSDDHLHFDAKFLPFKLYIDGNLVQSSVEPWNGETPESYFYHIELIPDMAGREVRLEIEPSYADSAVLFSNMMICSTSSYVEFFIKKYGVSLILSFLLVVLGAALIFMVLTQPKTEGRNEDYSSLGIFAILLGTWSIIETQVPMLVMGSGTIKFLQIDNFCICMMTYFFYRFCVSTLSWRSRRLDWIVMLVSMGLTLTVEIQTSFHFKTWHRTLSLIYLIFGVSLGGLFFSLYKTFRYHRKKKDIEKPLWLVIMGMTAFMVSIIVDGLRYVLPQVPNADSAFATRIGSVIMMVLMITQFTKTSIERAHIAGRSEVLEKLAYTDVLTGCGNRTAYEEYGDQLQKAAEADESYDFLVISFDINNLKQVNDSLGHDKGDAHIRAAADVLGRSFGKTAKYYRTGGDEFMALMTGRDLKERAVRLIEEMRELEGGYNAEETTVYPLHIACGYAAISEAEGRKLKEAARISDSRMYENKKELKNQPK